MDPNAGAGLLNTYAQTKVGNDIIFTWWARYQKAIEQGDDAVNGTIGALLEDDGSLAINQVVDEAIRVAPAVEIAAYAPLKGLPAFLDLAKSLALGEHREPLNELGISLRVALAHCISLLQIFPIEATKCYSVTVTGALTMVSCQVVTLA
jgi:hypothetical protein